MNPIRFRTRRVILICAFLAIIGFLFHEKLFNQIDRMTMPDSSELCKIAPEELLQRLRINEEEHIVDIEKRLKNTPLQHGGKYRPSSQSIRSKNKKLAIIVPYRDRLVNLEILLKNLHPFLMQQNIYYSIYELKNSKFYD